MRPAAGCSVVALLALVGCGRPETGPVASLGVASWADAIEQGIDRQTLARFGERLHGVTVRLEAVPDQAEYRERILTSIAAGVPPDVALLDDIDIPAFASRNLLLDLGPLAARVGLDTAAFDPRVRAIFTVDGQLLAFPKGYTPIVVVYNRRLFDAAHLPYPSADWTWDDFDRTAKALTRDTDGDGQVDQWGALFDRRPFLWIPWIWSGGGDVLCADGRRASGCLDSPATERAFRWYLDWVERDSVSPRAYSLRSSLGDNFRLFNGGKIAMMTAGHFWLPRLREYAEQGRTSIGFVGLPHRVGSPPATIIYATGWAVPRNVTNRRLAVTLAAFLADSAAQRIRAAAGLEIPGTVAAAAELLARDTTGWEQAFQGAMANGRAPWGVRVRGWREVDARLPEIMDQVLLQGRDLHAALTDAARDIDAILRETER
ncbi:MAG: ABC transporter substrate-binding protein [Gemmatimonadales bacterium]